MSQEIDNINKNQLYELVHPDCKKFISEEYCEFFETYLIPIGIKFPDVLVNPDILPTSVEEIHLPCEVEKISAVLEILYTKFLKSHRVKFHDLKKKTGEYKGNSLALAAFLSHPFQFIHKDVLSKFIRDVTGNSQGDYQARHLAAQDGWNILNKNETYLGSFRTKSGYHMMIDFTGPKKGYVPGRREDMLTSFEDIKEYYGNRCATCGAKEGEMAPRNPSKKTTLQKGHLNPNLPLTDNNTIPQCEECNQLYKNDYVFDENGIAVALASSKVFRNTSKDVKSSCYEQLNINEKIDALKVIMESTQKEEDKQKLMDWLKNQLDN
jgi:hypothetical protein